MTAPHREGQVRHIVCCLLGWPAVGQDRQLVFRLRRWVGRYARRSRRTHSRCRSQIASAPRCCSVHDRHQRAQTRRGTHEGNRRQHIPPLTLPIQSRCPPRSGQHRQRVRGARRFRTAHTQVSSSGWHDHMERDWCVRKCNSVSCVPAKHVLTSATHALMPADMLADSNKVAARLGNGCACCVTLRPSNGVLAAAARGTSRVSTSVITCDCRLPLSAGSETLYCLRTEGGQRCTGSFPQGVLGRPWEGLGRLGKCTPSRPHRATDVRPPELPRRDARPCWLRV